MLSIVIVIITVLLIFVIFLGYFEKFDCVIAYTGGLGSGKTFKAVQQSIKLLKRNRLKVWFENFKTKIHNFFNKEKKSIVTDIPMLYSSIPVFIKQKRKKFKMYNLVELKYWFREKYGYERFITREQFDKDNILDSSVKCFIESSLELTEEYLLLQKKLHYRSIVFLDEIGGYVSQYEYSNPNVLFALDEFIRLFRHYTKGGHLICTEQCSDSICKSIRVRLNKVFNLMDFKNVFNLLYIVRIRQLSLSEDIKTVEQMNTEDNMKVNWGLFPRRKRYDTYCYSERYESVPYADMKQVFESLKRYTLLKVSKRVVKPLTTDKRI